MYSLMWILIYTTIFIRMYNLPQFYNYIFLTPGTFTYLSPGLFGCVLAERARQDTKIAGGHVAFPGMYYLYSDEWNKKPLGFSCSDSAPLRSTIRVRELTLGTSLSLFFLFLPPISFSSSISLSLAFPSLLVERKRGKRKKDAERKRKNRKALLVRMSRSVSFYRRNPVVGEHRSHQLPGELALMRRHPRQHGMGPDCRTLPGLWKARMALGTCYAMLRVHWYRETV